MSAAGEWLALGTVQLGMPYGVANFTGQPAIEDARRILDAAWSAGIRCFDTAQGYGDSEWVLGSWWRDRLQPEDFRVVTKLNPRLDPRDEAALLWAVEQSLERLGAHPLWGLMLHRENWLGYWGGKLGRVLEQVQSRGWVERLGVSVYTPDRALEVIGNPAFTILQAPLNVFDRRMIRAGILDAARQKNKKVFLRSVYLQGLVLMDIADAARAVPAAGRAVTALERFCSESGVSRGRFAFGYVRHRAPEAVIVIGAESVRQVAENIVLANEQPPDPSLFDEWDRFWPDDDDAFINPSKWFLKKS